MTEGLLVPDSRARQALIRRNRLLEQNMKYLGVVQRRTAREKKDDLDALITAITRLATSITQVVRLHHQIWRSEEAIPEDMLTALMEFVDTTGTAAREQEAP